ncbi:uba ts-n domain-containing protein [Colletotrichum tabaci]|uniref:Uba ts-n domain-containing protein n=1 Tax=Colletotrichum tabaci TaxID=1209068 RepID=A0AAV9TDK1_9PEZI
MDDLSGLNWSASANQPNNKPPPMNPSGANYFGSIRPANSTPSPFPSGRNTPLSAQGSGPVAAKPAAAKPAADSFSNLLSFGAAGAAKPTSKLTLLEQQQQLEAEKRKKEEERRKQAQAQFGGGFLDTLGSGSVSRTASPGILSPGSSTGKKATDDDDLFAAFNSETKVDNASFYPPPPQKSPSPANAPGLDLSNPSAWNQAPSVANNGVFGDDDDPFGLNQLKPKAASPAPPLPTDDDDDFLGDLARPVEEVRRKQPTPPQPQHSEPGKPIEASDSSSEDERPAPRGEMAEFDRAVAQLVDYGFTPENARRGLTESGAGLNVQAAANWLLDDAHRQAKAKAQGKSPAVAQRRGREDGSSSQDGQRRTDTRSPAGGDPDLSKTAAAVGNSLFKTANSLWKTGKKQVQQAVADFNQPEGDPNQPKWMRSAQVDRTQPEKRVPKATDEALMLESGGRPPRKAGQSSQSPRPDAPRRTASPRDHSPAVSAPSSGRGTPVPRWQQQGGPALPDSRTRASKLAMADDNAASYVSPHRRKKGTPQPEAPTRPQQDEPDLLFSSQTQAPKQAQSLPQRPAQPSQSSTRPAQPAQRPSPPAPKPAPRPARQIPSISPAAIQQSTKHRLDGTAHFKRGDYGAAHSSYSSSLAAVPPSHPLAIVILTNRALTALKTGEPKQAVEDADAALKIIGPAGGQGEHVAVLGDNGGEERREMRDLYGKALSRKAEALEQMERWGEAHAVWSTCVKDGVGGPSAISGRQRCQSALAPKPKPKPRPAAAARPRPAAAPAKSSDAVERLRKQNQAAAQEDDEKFALSEKVDAKIAAWRDGKRENLRALIGSLDQVLWEGSGWKKVGLHELVMANKVKIHYMKAIAKCHPDKLPQDASTEVRLIAATVFATLNESWDKFKAENGL